MPCIDIHTLINGDCLIQTIGRPGYFPLHDRYGLKKTSPTGEKSVREAHCKKNRLIHFIFMKFSSDYCQTFSRSAFATS